MAGSLLQRVIQEVDDFPPEQLPALLQMMRLLRKNLMLNSPAKSFRQAWKEAMNSETLPITELWTDIDAA